MLFSLLHKCLNSQIFDLKYAGLLALEKLGDQEGKKMIAEDEDWLILSKANRI